jgi:hypothetical protein
MRPIFFLAITAMIVSLCFAKGERFATPQKGTKLAVVKVNNKNYKYWLVEQSKPTFFEVEGPSMVQIFLRTEAGKKTDIKFTVDGLNPVLKTLEQKESKSSAKGFSKITDAKVFQLKVEKGKHKISIESNSKILVRVVFKKKLESVALVPFEHAGSVVVVSNETELGYYFGTKDKQMRFTILGPGTVTVDSRLIYDKSSMGKQSYILGTKLDADAEKTYQFETEPSGVTTLKMDKTSIPGKVKSAKIKIGEGKHTLSVYSVGSSKVAVRLSLPLSMLKK